MENEWLRMNQGKISDTQYLLTEIAYKNENPGIPVGEIRGLIGACVVEIKKQQKIINDLKLQLSVKEQTK